MRLAVIAVLFVLSSACAGVRTSIAHAGLRYPVSMSGTLPDAYGNLHVLGHNLEDVGPLDESMTVFGVGYGLQTRAVDISGPINARIASLHGDGVVQLALISQSCALNFFFPLNLLPFWPGCVDIGIHGRVVRVKSLETPDIRLDIL
jgi:hypothetical protein